VLDAILWHVLVGKAFVIYAQDHGNRIIKIILSAIFIRKTKINRQIDKNKYYKE
jgi:hypothetical protein